MAYLAYNFVVQPPVPGSEILAALIADMGFDTFDYNEKGFTAFIREEDNNNVHLEGLDFEEFHFSYTIERIEQENWNAEWEKNFERVYVDDLLLIRAPFHEPDARVREEIVIMPKMSFGTGHHQTTRLMCRQMFDMDFKNKRVLDMGCGTAVLAILAEKLGAADILGIDIDAWSVENSIENCGTNHCSKIKLKLGDVDLLEAEAAFDIIIANINKNILKAQLPTYARKLPAGGQLLLSGFFTTDVDELTKVAETLGLKFVSRRQEQEWAMMLLSKK